MKISRILATTSLLSFVSSMQGLGLNNMATVQPDHDLTRKRVQILHSCTRVCFLRRVRVRGTWKCARIWRDEDNDKSNLGHKRRPLGRPKTLRASQRLTYTVSAAAEKRSLLSYSSRPSWPRRKFFGGCCKMQKRIGTYTYHYCLTGRSRACPSVPGRSCVT